MITARHTRSTGPIADTSRPAFVVGLEDVERIDVYREVGLRHTSGRDSRVVPNKQYLARLRCGTRCLLLVSKATAAEKRQLRDIIENPRA